MSFDGRGRWYYTREGQKFGPYSSAELREFANQGLLLPTDQVAMEDRPETITAGSIEKLFPTLELKPAPEPAQSRRAPEPKRKKKKRTHVDVPKKRGGAGKWILAGLGLTAIACTLLAASVYFLTTRNNKKPVAKRKADTNKKSTERKGEDPKNKVAKADDPPKKTADDPPKKAVEPPKTEEPKKTVDTRKADDPKKKMVKDDPKKKKKTPSTYKGGGDKTVADARPVDDKKKTYPPKDDKKKVEPPKKVDPPKKVEPPPKVEDKPKVEPPKVEDKPTVEDKPKVELPKVEDKPKTEPPKATDPKPDDKPIVGPDYKVVIDPSFTPGLDTKLPDTPLKPDPPVDTKLKPDPLPDTKTKPPEIKPPDTKAKPLPETQVKPLDPKVKPQVEAALRWIAKNQLKEGNWQVSGVDNNPQGRVVVASFSAMALMAAGDQYQAQVGKAAQFVADNIFVARPAKTPEKWDQSNWKIAIGGLFLCEYYAFLQEKNLTYQAAKYRKILEKVVEEVCKRQEESGGWGHTPKIKNPLGYVELEVMSNWMMMTMGACQRLGINVPQANVKKAVQFVEDCCAPGRGQVGYSPRTGQKGMLGVYRTGGALCAFGLLEQQNHRLYPRMVSSYRQQWASESGEGHGSIALGYLGSAVGARQVGGETWTAFESKFFPAVTAKASADGTFKHLSGKTPIARGFDDKNGPAYNTSIYTLFLQLDRGGLKFVGQRF